ncbi:hypothetical protein EJB05_08724 [Eragrostis curvula]|uniref:C2H2-type domain-containing protein n=1 Tax=Eragrostis curvula TaxID=38414 RepID=A0A5J9W347_9POAL|nr:hypothetical protein EJB05_08724 [Eragrostis curvula]
MDTEFLYRAGDVRRSVSPSPPTPVPPPPAPASADSPPAAMEADAAEARRQEEKARIRERILREETVERWELEIEVRRELVKQFRQGSIILKAGTPEPPVMVTAANSSSPVALEIAKANSKDNASAASLVKRKSPDDVTASVVSAETSSKKQKLNLTCTVCGITANAEKAMQDHLNGKNHKRKAASLAAQTTTKLEPNAEPEASKEEGAVLTVAPSGDFKQTKLTMLTNAGVLNEVTQMNGYLLCELCNVRTADRVTMMCHLDGTKHISKAQLKKCPGTSEPPAGTAPTKCVNGHAALAAVAGDDTKMVVLEVEGEQHSVRREGGFLLCECCDVKAPSKSGMQSHLLGKKHKKKANGTSVAPVHIAKGGMGAAESHMIDKDTAIVEAAAVHIEAPLANPKQENVGDGSELQETAEKLAKEVVISVECSKTQGMELEKVSTGTPVATANAAGDTDLAMEVDGVRHPLQRVEGFLFCPCCEVKAPSDIVMRSHLVGKKHKTKMTSAAAIPEANGLARKGSFVAASLGQANGIVPKMEKDGEEEDSKPSETMVAKNAAGSALVVEVDAAAEVEAAMTPADPGNGSVTQVNGSVKTNDITESGKPMKVLVDGKLFVVLHHDNGALSCEPCGVHGCNRDAMLKHLYTRTHWEKARPAEEKELAEAADPAVAEDGDGRSLAGEGTAQVEK